MNNNFKDKVINQFIKEVIPILKKEIKPEEILFFGSRVTGEAKEESDLDVILISEYFKNIPFIKRMPLVLKKIKFNKHVDILCYSQDEFERIKKTSSIIENALIFAKQY